MYLRLKNHPLVKIILATLILISPLYGNNDHHSTENMPSSEISQDASETVIHKTHGLSLFGSLKYPKDFQHFDYVTQNLPKRGTIRLSSIGGFDSFNPFNGKGEAAPGINLMHDSLLQRAYDEPGSEYGFIAQEIHYPSDYSWVEYHLRPEARFSDGQPITADDVVFSFNILMEKGNPIYRFYYANVDHVRKISKHIVRFSFNTQGNRELPLITGQLPILAKHYWQKQDFSKASLDIPVVSGPYVIDQFTPNRSISYRLQDDYWGKDLPTRRGVYNFKTVNYELYRDALVAFEAFKAGEYDYHLETSAKNWTTGYDFEAFKAGQIIKKTFHSLNPKPFQGLIFNLRRPLLQDKALREALGLMFDFEWFNQNLFYKAYARTQSFFEESEMEAKGRPSASELRFMKSLSVALPKDIKTWNVSQQPCESFRYCARKAKKILTDAGYYYQQGMLVSPNHEKVSLEILNHSPLMERVLLPLSEKMKKIGVQVSLRSMDSAQYIRHVNQFDYDMIVSVWAQSPSPGNEQREYWGSDAALREGSRNYAGLQDPAIDAVIERVIFAKDRSEQITAIKVLDRLLRYKIFAIPMWHAPFDRVAYWDKFILPPEKKTYGASNSIIFWGAK